MSDFKELIDVIKKASTNVVSDDKPAKILIGKVTSVEPLTVYVDEKFIIPNELLILSRNVTNFETELDFTKKTSVGGTGATTKDAVNIKKVIVLNELKTGEFVILQTLLNGQKFLILDRLGE